MTATSPTIDQALQYQLFKESHANLIGQVGAQIGTQLLGCNLQGQRAYFEVFVRSLPFVHIGQKTRKIDSFVVEIGPESAHANNVRLGIDDMYQVVPLFQSHDPRVGPIDFSRDDLVYRTDRVVPVLERQPGFVVADPAVAKSLDMQRSVFVDGSSLDF